jgi:hypothetical protein
MDNNVKELNEYHAKIRKIIPKREIPCARRRDPEAADYYVDERDLEEPQIREIKDKYDLPF